jgi:hypothetical protein
VGRTADIEDEEEV